MKTGSYCSPVKGVIQSNMWCFIYLFIFIFLYLKWKLHSEIQFKHFFKFLKKRCSESIRNFSLKMQNHFLLHRRPKSVPFDLYRIFRRLCTWISSLHDKRGGKLTETISFYLLAITVVKYGRHEPYINQFSLDECALREAFCQGCLTAAASLCRTLALSFPALLNLF